ncbi:uncharacterized protein LOC9643578 [Selaginella moellendorffii]|uniref:uncharacterized protein LOC9643578 n=1 Tax=Selaginella moellendorffii TaxID=88036 RepID=UPI000D1CBCAD|nr:uncharacterized protein LOC9643578 [Selaginella moellendorffii]|eukprot:XP_024521809.1 uncharacterized protein LOC9643578 [Selaginella moellendorffii]
MAMALEAQCTALINLRQRSSIWSAKASQYRPRSALRCCGPVVFVQGIQLEHIKSWIQDRFEHRKRLIGIDDAEESGGTIVLDLDLAVMLAGFAFESYNSPPPNVGIRETDGQSCETTYMSDGLIRELYQGQLTVKLEKGVNLPGLDLWGTSDPYVWLRIGNCAKQSKTAWATKDPVWNETLVLNVADPLTQSLKVAVWDANILSVHKRLGNYEVELSTLCDGTAHDIEMQLEGMGGGGSLYLKVQYKSFADIDGENSVWEVPFLSDLIKGGIGNVLTSVLGPDGIKVQDFVGSTIGSLHLLPSTSAANETDQEASSNGADLINSVANAMKNCLGGFDLHPSSLWNFHGEDHDTLKESGLELQARAEAHYLEKRLVHPSSEESESIAEAVLPEVKETLLNISGRVEETLGSLLMLAMGRSAGSDKANDAAEVIQNSPLLDVSQREQMREMFKRAETAMEAWAILSTSLGRTSFVRSEFEKICFLESKNTDTQVAVWRDLRGKRLVVAFRGTEQDKWRDLATDLMLAPTGFNPERVADGGSDDEIMVHSGFLTAYDSVRHRLLSIIKASITSRNDEAGDAELSKWHIYITGHSLGGALATLLAMDLSKTMFKHKGVNLSMYNFGSPRVGNRAFADQYNKVIKDSWRIVNHRDIIPTVPRLMGYCHVAQAIYLSSLEKTSELEEDVIGEATPGGIVGEFLKGEKQLINKLIQTEIAMLRTLRDGTALMQHMEDFYYISLLERARSAGTNCNVTEICAALSTNQEDTKAV